MAGIALLCGIENENTQLHAQTVNQPIEHNDTLHWMFRIYEDNDFLNARGCGTDDAYTNGTRFDYFYRPKLQPRNPVDRLLPKAGLHAVNIYGWGMMQQMYTPSDITDSAYQPHDYPWSGALFFTHTLYSSNPEKKYDLRTELDLGVIGPASLARQLQTGFHRLIHYFKPRGWSHQYPNDVLANIDVTAEHRLAGNGSAIEWIGGGTLSAGTMINSITVYPLLRIGRLNPYFQGLFQQYASQGGSKGRGNRRHKNWQLYFICRPELQLIATEAVLQGGIFSHNPNITAPGGPQKPQQEAPVLSQPYRPINHVVFDSNFGAVASIGNISISFNQNSSTAMMKGLYAHEVGNISLYFGW